MLMNNRKKSKSWWLAGKNFNEEGNVLFEGRCRQPSIACGPEQVGGPVEGRIRRKVTKKKKVK